jgi:hypothetical protein
MAAVCGVLQLDGGKQGTFGIVWEVGTHSLESFPDLKVIAVQFYPQSPPAAPALG